MTLRTDLTNDDAQADTHPAQHNEANTAILDLQTRVGDLETAGGGGSGGVAPEQVGWGEWATVNGSGFASGIQDVKPSTKLTGNGFTAAHPSISYASASGRFTFSQAGVYAFWAYVSVKSLAANATVRAYLLGGNTNLFDEAGPDVTQTSPSTAQEIRLAHTAWYPANAWISMKLSVNNAGTTWNTDGRFLIATRIA